MLLQELPESQGIHVSIDAHPAGLHVEDLDFINVGNAGTIAQGMVSIDRYSVEIYLQSVITSQVVAAVLSLQTDDGIKTKVSSSEDEVCGPRADDDEPCRLIVRFRLY